MPIPDWPRCSTTRPSDLRAAEVARELADRLKKETVADEETTKELCKTYDARANFLFACHWAAAGDRAKQRQFLDRALAIDPTDVDVLIACYHLPDAPPEYREKIRELIRRRPSRGMRMEALTSPDKRLGLQPVGLADREHGGRF